MSSSAPKRQPAASVPASSTAISATGLDTAEVSPFAYAEAGLGDGAANAFDPSQSAEERGRRQQAEVFEKGRQAGQQQLRSELDAALTKNRAEIARALQQFALERQNYYRRVESEVVQLALAIARKILHREVQIDPQILTGIVRVTLEKLDSGTRVALHVHPLESAQWRRHFASQPADVPAPEIREDPALAFGECRIETSVGSTEVGLATQLKEIETGLLDLLAERPGGAR